MEALKHFLKFFVVYIVILPAITNQSPTLNSTLIRGQYACPRHQVNFTCVLSNGAYILVWTSEQYIGIHEHIELTHDMKEGHNEESPINPYTVATVIRVNGGRIVESSLRLTTSASFPMATVGCSRENLQPFVINFYLLEIPNAPRNVTAVKETSPPDSDCMIHLKWQPPDNKELTDITHYVIIVEYTQSLPFTMSSSSPNASLTVNGCAEDAVIIVSAIDACGREGPSSNGTLEDLLVSNPPTTAMTASSQLQTDGLRTDDVNDTNSSPVTIVGGVLGTALLLIVLVIAIVAITIGVKMNSKRHRDRDRSQSRVEISSTMNPLTQRDSSSSIQSQPHETSPPERTGSPRIEVQTVDDEHEDPTTGSEKNKTDETKLLPKASDLVNEPAERSRASSDSSALKFPLLRAVSNKVEEIARSNSLSSSGGSYKRVPKSND